MTTTILSIIPYGINASHVLVDAHYANSLHRFIHNKSITVSPPQEAVSRTVRAYVDSEGRKIIETEPLDMTFKASATPEELESVVAEWIPTISDK